MRACSVVVVVAGCNAAFGLDRTALVDAPSCTPVTSQFDDFEQPTTKPCGWGYLTQSSCTAIAANGMLSMTPAAGTGNTLCACLASSPMTFTPAFGTMTEVIDLATQVGEYTQFSACDPTAASCWSIETNGAGMIGFLAGTTRLGSVPRGASTRWWRIRPDDGGTAVLGEVSPDGKSWSAIAMAPATPPATIKFSLGTGTFQAVAAPSTVHIGSINVCPP